MMGPMMGPDAVDPREAWVPEQRAVLALDLGGNTFAGAVVDQGGRILESARVRVPPGGDAETLWWALDDLVGRLVDRSPGRYAGVGVGCSGPMRWPAGEVSPVNVPGWRGFPLAQRLAQRLDSRLAGEVVRVHNDAVCAAVGEHWRGAGRGTSSLLGVVVSTGVGGGLVLDGRLVDGPSGNAGHIGHVVVDPDGEPCGCGGIGCLETVASGPGLVRWATAQGWRHPGGDARHLALDAERGHPVAQRALARAGRALGTAIASATHLCDLQVVTVGGGVAQAGPLLLGPVEEAVRRHARLAFARDVRVVPAALGMDAGLVGAAALVLAGGRYWSPAR